MEHMKAARRDSFVARAVRFICDSYPGIAKRADAAELASLVDFAIQRANVYGFVSERDIVKYLTVMVALGAHFDEDARFSMLRLPLSGMGRTSPEVRIAYLVAMTTDLISDSHVGR